MTALVGPSGCGKSTFLRVFNRMNDYIDSFKIEGNVFMEGQNIYDKVRVDELRKILEWFFKNQILFKSIYENVVYGLKFKDKG